ncbi:MAG: 3-deoxy-manno-octulosonate cytidylyltransferase [Cytophagales bacterium]|nr:MAG: 3-deoxy-manno-octulosonate cytidylyltransferase [Rhodothermaeota bacterium MED-G19]
MKIIGIIPARMESSRLPGKPLIKIGGKTMIKRVYESVVNSKLFDKVLVATPNKDIFDHVNDFGEVLMTSNKPLNGTERVFEAYQKINGEYDFIVNIQGDEPFIKKEQLSDIISICKKPNQICTLIKEEKYSEALDRKSIMKVVINKNNEAMYFSRTLIPHQNIKKKYFKHICIYAYDPITLKALISLPPSSLELSESLEQLRWLENGFKIKVKITKSDSFSVDTKEDLILAENYKN